MWRYRNLKVESIGTKAFRVLYGIFAIKTFTVIYCFCFTFKTRQTNNYLPIKLYIKSTESKASNVFFFLTLFQRKFGIFSIYKSKQINYYFPNQLNYPFHWWITLLPFSLLLNTFSYSQNLLLRLGMRSFFALSFAGSSFSFWSLLFCRKIKSKLNCLKLDP